jgi:hypothetical protein
LSEKNRRERGMVGLVVRVVVRKKGFTVTSKLEVAVG